jgi:hypothetical protein
LLDYVENKMKKPSELLEESATPFDLACMQVRHLEEAAVKLMDGKDYHKLNGEESHMLGVMTGMGLLETKDGFVRATK